MAVKVQNARQSHRFHSMKLLHSEGGGRPGDVYLNVTALVDMMMVLVIFLVMNFNATGEMLFLTKDMEMPAAEHGGTITRIPIVAVSFNPDTQARELYFEGQMIADLNAIDYDSGNLIIQELENKLVENRSAFEMVSAGRSEELPPEENPTTTINLQVDSSTDYRIIKRVLATCEANSYARIRLTVGDGRRAAGVAIEE